MNSRVQRIWWRGLRLLGLSRLSWDQQYQAGLWNAGTRSPLTIEMVSTLCSGGRLVEFGCGEGELPYLLPDDCYTEYWGYDISAVAVGRATQRAVARGRGGIHFEQMDMAKWPGADGVALIVVEECLYYLDVSQIESFLSRCVRSLNCDGHVLIVVHSPVKHASTIETCRRCCNVVSERTHGSRVYLVLEGQRS
jgi:SAM-dependent methyltransferase